MTPTHPQEATAPPSTPHAKDGTMKLPKIRGPLAAFRNLRTARKLLVAFLAVSTLMVAIGFAGMNRLGASQASLEGMYHDNLEAISWLGRVDVDVQTMRAQVNDLAVARDDTEAQKTLGEIKTLDADIDTYWAKYKATSSGAEQQQYRDGFEAALFDYQQVRDSVMLPLAQAGKTHEFLVTSGDRVAPIAQKIRDNLETLQHLEDRDAAAALAAAQTSYRSTQLLVILFIGLSVAMSIFLALAIGRMVSRPLRRTVAVLEELAEGRLDQRLDVRTRDEVGQMARALNKAMAGLREAMSAMGSNSQALASASEELSSVSVQMTGTAHESASQAELVSAAAEQVSRNVQTVATGSEEMSSSIREIAQNATNAAGVAAEAVLVAESTNATVAKLGDVLGRDRERDQGDHLDRRADQPARPQRDHRGRPGRRGRQGLRGRRQRGQGAGPGDRKATEDISRRIEAIQGDTEAAVTAIGQIAVIIAQINDIQMTIASAVEEQTATTNEMSRNVAEAATGSTDIARNITGVAKSATDTGAAATSTHQAAEELARMAAEMQQLVGRFSY